jgi:hypothetical protein
MLVRICYANIWILLLTPRYAPFLITTTIVHSVVSGWNIDVADMGYKVYFQVYPFHWVVYLMRWVLYGSLPEYVSISWGVLCLYCTVAMLGYGYLLWRKERIESMSSLRPMLQGNRASERKVKS